MFSSTSRVCRLETSLELSGIGNLAIDSFHHRFKLGWLLPWLHGASRKHRGLLLAGCRGQASLRPIGGRLASPRDQLFRSAGPGSTRRCVGGGGPDRRETELQGSGRLDSRGDGRGAGGLAPGVGELGLHRRGGTYQNTHGLESDPKV